MPFIPIKNMLNRSITSIVFARCGLIKVLGYAPIYWRQDQSNLAVGNSFIVLRYFIPEYGARRTFCTRRGKPLRKSQGERFSITLALSRLYRFHVPRLLIHFLVRQMPSCPCPWPPMHQKIRWLAYRMAKTDSLVIMTRVRVRRHGRAR